MISAMVVWEDDGCTAKGAWEDVFSAMKASKAEFA